MTIESVSIIGPLNPRDVSDGDIAAFNVFQNVIQKERLPKEPSIPVEKTAGDLRNIPDFVKVDAWMVWTHDGSQVVAHAFAAFFETNENQHLAESQIEVLPEWRRKGMATWLLRNVTETAESRGRRLLMGRSFASVPAGAKFAQRIGADPGQVQTVNELDLTTVDRGLLRQWQERARERAGGLRLGVWRGPYPEDEMDRVCALYESINLMPRGDLDMEDYHFTAEQIRALDKSLFDRDMKRWTMFVEDPETGKIAGYTEVIWNPHKPDLLEQGGTAVFPEYQNRGLGRWLKGAMTELVFEELPQARRIHTGNANSNAPMLAINREMGFTPYLEETVWQVDLARVSEYVGVPQAAPSR